MTLINPAEKIIATPSVGRPSNQEAIQFIQDMEARMEARFAQAHRDLDTLSVAIRETRESIRDSQPAEAPNCFQQIGQFFVRAFRAIGLIR